MLKPLGIATRTSRGCWHSLLVGNARLRLSDLLDQLHHRACPVLPTRRVKLEMNHAPLTGTKKTSIRWNF